LALTDVKALDYAIRIEPLFLEIMPIYNAMNRGTLNSVYSRECYKKN